MLDFVQTNSNEGEVHLPKESEEQADAFTGAYAELCENAVALLVNVGIISSIRERWPENVQTNWVDEIQQMGEKLSDMTRVAQEFASGLD